MLFLGKCGGLKKTKVGDFILPIAAIRGEGTSNDYMPPEIPALPSFRLQKAVSAMIVKHGLDYWTGTVYTTNRRVWEHDEKFKEYLKKIRASAIDMETATIFIVGFVNHIPKGALLLVSDSPMTPEGVKTSRSDKAVTEKIRAQAPGDRHRFADRAARFRGVGQAHAVRVDERRVYPDDEHVHPGRGYFGFRVIGFLKLAQRRDGAGRGDRRLPLPRPRPGPARRAHRHPPGPRSPEPPHPRGDLAASPASIDPTSAPSRPARSFTPCCTSIEGIGLILGYHWAGYLVVVATSSLIPFEIYEIARKFSPIRVALFVLNVAIVIYLIVTLRKDRRERSRDSA